MENTNTSSGDNTILSEKLIKQIMNATDRFQFIKEEPEMNTMLFWDNCWEKEHRIGKDWTLENLIQWITKFYAEDYEWRGEMRNQRKIRVALGLE